MEKFNVLFVNSFSAIGGAESSLRVLVRGINREKFRLFALLPENGLLNKFLIKQGVRVKVLPLNKLKAKNPFPYILTVFQLMLYMKKKNINLVHCNHPLCNQYVLPAARLAGIPIISHVRNVYTKRAFNRLFLNYSDCLIAITQTVANSIKPFTRNSQKIVIVRNGIDFTEWSLPYGNPISWRQKLGISEDTFVIGQFGRIVPEKGHDTLIRAMKEVVLNNPDVCCVIAGDTKIDNTGGYLSCLKKLISDLDLSGRVYFTGFVEDMIPLYECIDVLVIPSIDDACGRTGIEAMALGKPIVVSAVGTALEMITDNINGFLFTPGDSSALTEILLKLLGDPMLLKTAGENGKGYVKENYNAKKHVRCIEDIYIKILNN